MFKHDSNNLLFIKMIINIIERSQAPADAPMNDTTADAPAPDAASAAATDGPAAAPPADAVRKHKSYY
jgi:hypothetical protein